MTNEGVVKITKLMARNKKMGNATALFEIFAW